MTAISSNYRELHGAEVDEIAAQCKAAWMDPRIPQRQYEMVLRAELEQFRQGELNAAFAALQRCLKPIMGHCDERPRFLDIGAACGFVSELLEGWEYPVTYTAADISTAFRDFALSLYPMIDYDVADAISLPYRDDYFDVVLSGGCIMHCRDYEKAIQEAIRVSKRFVIFHRTPILNGCTTFYLKEAYGVPCLEVHLNEDELLRLFDYAGATMIYSTEIADQTYRSYVLEKSGGLNHVQV